MAEKLKPCPFCGGDVKIINAEELTINNHRSGGERVMATCKDCVHVDVCCSYLSTEYNKCKLATPDFKLLKNTECDECQHFKDRSRFVELPCKVGDTAWILVRYKNGDGYFYTGIVTGVHVTDRKTIYKLPCKRFNYIVIRFLQTDSLKRINFNEIGKTIFFTKEEAEKALKESKKDE